ncbi:ectoine/hydroxyectoine ABC transporter permease subunit EhuD [Arthrobacter sp. HMWF013]|uniref:ectoine/hydroxyectoine ABC transporter permease subunit EhuD n=1 Tax=Arthrobacter sp. HMWF013 TaxID=2056849 RepID=UPI000D3C4CC2|nr:ectoine/hydroxyectoine ABC transporter permease subunit EhuD [Arthrobacter sp. HMWF013]PTT68759.1 ectoine/hydroxyectoine ABC transporter permease subunit EhuD [Arthrobacter sp. HMWF013]
MKFNLEFALSILPELLQGAILTLAATLGGMALALVGGLILSVLQQARLWPVRFLANGYIAVVRSTPLLIQLFFLFYILPEFGVTAPAFWTGVLGLGLHYSAYTAEVYRAGLENVPRGQWEAATALHLSIRDTWTKVVMPQAIPPMVPMLGNYLIAMFKDTPILATITVIELFGAANQVAGITYRYFEPYTLVGLIFLALSIPSVLLINRADRRFSLVR